MTSNRRVSVRDVARFAGVSQATVSNVLNHPDRVRPAKRQAVENAIRTLGFVRHEAARHLRAGYSSTVGLLLLDWSPAFTDIARGVDEATAAHGLTVLISNSSRDTEREKTYLRLFSEQRVAGLIVVPNDTLAEGVHQIRAGGIPVVIVDRAETGDQALSVAVDDITGGELAARHLIDLGHRRLAFVGDEAAAFPVLDRLTGVRKAIAEGGVDIRLDVFPAALSAEAGRDVGERFASMPPTKRPTGVMTGVDMIAVGVLQALLQRGIQVPADISLVGYDDVPFARQLSIPLTTIRRPHYDMGITAAEMLATVLCGKQPQTRHAVFSPELIVRESTAAPKPHPSRRKAS